MWRRRLLAVTLSVCLMQLCVPLNALADAQTKGGAGPFFASCCIGPRVGLEMNEGKEIKGTEWVRTFATFVPYIGGIIWLVVVVMQGSNTGFNGVMAECCIGPRVGEQLNERRIRSIEWVSAIPLIGIIPHIMMSADAANGRTVLEIEAKENLRRTNPSQSTPMTTPLANTSSQKTSESKQTPTP